MTPNKYHSSGRLYTSEELAARAYDLLPRMVVKGYSTPNGGKTWAEAPIKPHDIGRNKTKRIKRQLKAQRRAQLLAATSG